MILTMAVQAGMLVIGLALIGLGSIAYACVVAKAVSDNYALKKVSDSGQLR